MNRLRLAWAAPAALLLLAWAGACSKAPTPQTVNKETKATAKADEAETKKPKIPPLSEEDKRLIAADPATLTPEERRARGYALRRQVMQNPDSPTARALQDLAKATREGTIDPKARKRSGMTLHQPGLDDGAGAGLPPAGSAPAGSAPASSEPARYPTRRRQASQRVTAVPASLAETDLGDDVLRWELCRPQRRNPIDPAGLRWITQRCRDLAGQTVVITGRGEEAFCAGFDLNALAEHSDASHPDQPLIEATEAMLKANATFIARIGGYVIGAGVELACACDFRIGRRGVYFSVPASRLGVVYHPAGVARLHRVFGPALSRHLLVLGRRVTAVQAHAAGALCDFVEASELDAAVDRVVANLRRGTPRTIRAHRDLLRQLDRGAPTELERLDYAEQREAAYAELDAATARGALRKD